MQRGTIQLMRLFTICVSGSNETEDFITDAEGPFRYRFDCTVDDVSLGKTHHGFCTRITFLSP